MDSIVEKPLAATTEPTGSASEVVAERAEIAAQDTFDGRREKSWRTFIGRILCVVVPVALWFAPFAPDPTQQHALAVASFILVAWITQAMDQAIAGLVGCYLFWALGVVDFNIAFPVS